MRSQAAQNGTAPRRCISLFHQFILPQQTENTEMWVASTYNLRITWCNLIFPVKHMQIEYMDFIWHGTTHFILRFLSRVLLSYSRETWFGKRIRTCHCLARGG